MRLGGTSVNYLSHGTDVRVWVMFMVAWNSSYDREQTSLHECSIFVECEQTLSGHGNSSSFSFERTHRSSVQTIAACMPLAPTYDLHELHVAQFYETVAR